VDGVWESVYFLFLSVDKPVREINGRLDMVCGSTRSEWAILQWPKSECWILRLNMVDHIVRAVVGWRVGTGMWLLLRLHGDVIWNGRRAAW